MKYRIRLWLHSELVEDRTIENRALAHGLFIDWCDKYHGKNAVVSFAAIPPEHQR